MKILKSGYVEILIYDEKSNTLRGYLEVDEN